MYLKPSQDVERVESLPHKACFGLMSDLHIGSAGTDEDLIKRDLEWFRANNARILLNGDVFDLILPGDRKRFDTRGVHKDILGKVNVIDHQVELGVKILGPYADLIDLVGVGNHETAVEKFHSTDVTARLVRELHALGSTCEYGGYEGWYVKRWVSCQRNYHSLKIRYHHGFGASAPVTKGIIDFNRWQWIEGADVLWFGHRHNRIIDWTARESVSADGNVKTRPQLNVQTAAYYKPREGQSSEDAMRNGRQGNWAHDSGFATQATGGMLLEVTLRSQSRGARATEIRVVS